MGKSKAAVLEFTDNHIARFRQKVTQTASCWLWIGGIGTKGNGVFHFGRNGHMTAQRAAWLIASGEIPAGWDVYRICENKLCVRPDHLRIGKSGSSPLSRQQRLNALSASDHSGCIIFTGSVDRCGYGKFDGTLAHRAAWEIHHGPIPSGLYVCHKCDNPPCINPEHLFTGTQTDNMADMIAKGRQSKIGAPIGHIGAGRKLSDEQVQLARNAYSTGEVDMHQIALVLGVDQSVISRLINQKRYAKAPVRAALPT